MWAWWTSVKCGLFNWKWGATSLGMSQQALTHTHCRHAQARWGD